MAHPHHAHRQHSVEHSRVHHITRGYAHGGAVHSDAAEDAAQIKRLVKKSALKADGGKVKHRADRRARGGKVKSGKTTVNVIVAPNQEGNKPPMLPPGGPPPAAPMPAPVPPPRPPMAGPMAAGAPIPPPGIRKHGGRAGYAKGGAIKSGPGWTESMKDRKPFVLKSGNNKDDGKDIGRGRVVTYKRGGAVESSNAVSPATKLPGGSGGGEGRLAKASRARKDYAAA